MMSLLRSDLLKTRKRAAGWAMLAIGAALIALGLVITIFAPADGDLPSFAFPGGLLFGAQVIGQLGSLMMVVFGATLVGSEYGFDTWKNMLTRRPGRVAFILSKWITLALGLLIATIALPLWAQALGAALGGLLPASTSVAPPLGTALLQVALSALAPLAAGTIGVLGAVIGRSSVGGIVAGIAWLIVDAVLASILPGGLKLLSLNVALSSFGMNLVGEAAPFGLLPSLLVVAAYLVAPLALAAYLFRARDMV